MAAPAVAAAAGAAHPPMAAALRLPLPSAVVAAGAGAVALPARTALLLSALWSRLWRRAAWGKEAEQSGCAWAGCTAAAAAHAAGWPCRRRRCRRRRWSPHPPRCPSCCRSRWSSSASSFELRGGQKEAAGGAGRRRRLAGSRAVDAVGQRTGSLLWRQVPSAGSLQLAVEVPHTEKKWAPASRKASHAVAACRRASAHSAIWPKFACLAHRSAAPLSPRDIFWTSAPLARPASASRNPPARSHCPHCSMAPPRSFLLLAAVMLAAGMTR